MNTETRKKIAYELTLEYTKQGSDLKKNDTCIQEIVDNFEMHYKQFYDALKDKDFL